MTLTNLSVNDYIKTVASDAPAPGGGSASALAGAQGAGLVAMAAGLTVGKKKYADDWEHCARIKAEGEKLSDALTRQVDEDTAAFDLVSAAFKLPKETDGEKAARRAAIAKATVTATEAPLETMRLSVEALKLAKQLIGRFNTNCASDLGVGAIGLMAAVRGAWLNVLINLPGIAEPELANSLRERGEALYFEAATLETEVSSAVMQLL